MKESAFASAVRLIEDALVLAKRADPTAWLIYLAGVAPFFGLLLYEITDLAQNPFALARLGSFALALTILFIWLHICQSVFCARLQGILTETHLTARPQFAAALAAQSLLAPTKLISWPLALAVLIPYPVVTMFYQHSLVPARPPTGSATFESALAESKRDAAYRRGQAIWMLLLILLLRAILWINLFVLLLIGPSLWKTFTGLEGRLTRTTELLLNPTSFLALSIVAYIALDPIVKACCVLRRFARQAERSGLDLRLRLSVIRRSAAAAMLCLALCIPLRLKAAPHPASSALAVTPDQMRHAIEDVFHDPRNTWDLPVIETRKPASNPFTAFMDGLVDRLNALWKSIDSAIDAVLQALHHIFSNNQRAREENVHFVSRTGGWIVIACFSLLLATALLMALWNHRKQPRPQSVAAAVIDAKSVDIANEELSALDQPLDEWLKLAEQYRIAGNLRFAVRALYLSTLAALGRSGLISLARGKSNLDYLRELQRRARRLDPDFVSRFRANVGFFEESWYGAHPVTADTLDVFERNSSVLRSGL